MSQILIIVPHGDDEVLGFGGVISKHVASSDNVTVCFLKAFHNPRTYTQAENTIEAQAVLGYQERIQLDIEPAHLCAHDQNTLHRIEDVIARCSPDIIYIPSSSDCHQDHAMTKHYVRIATRVHGRSNVPQIFSGEIISSTENGFEPTFRPNYYVGLSDLDLAKKQLALKCYRKEVRDYPHPRSDEGLKIHAQKRGMECGTMYAEAFECLRYFKL